MPNSSSTENVHLVRPPLEKEPGKKQSAMEKWGRDMMIYGDVNIRKTRNIFMFIPTVIRRLFEMVIFPITAGVDRIIAILGLNAEFDSLLEPLDDDGNPIEGHKNLVDNWGEKPVGKVGFITYLLQVPMVLIEQAFSLVHQWVVRVACSIIYAIGLGKDLEKEKDKDSDKEKDRIFVAHKPSINHQHSHAIGWVKYLKDSYDRFARRLNVMPVVENFAITRMKVVHGSKVFTKVREYATSIGRLLYLVTLLPIVARFIDLFLDKIFGVRPEGSLKSSLFFHENFGTGHTYTPSLGEVGYVGTMLESAVSVVVRAVQMVYQAVEYISSMVAFAGWMLFIRVKGLDGGWVLRNSHTKKFNDSVGILKENLSREIDDCGIKAIDAYGLTQVVLPKWDESNQDYLGDCEAYKHRISHYNGLAAQHNKLIAEHKKYSEYKEDSNKYVGSIKPLIQPVDLGVVKNMIRLRNLVNHLNELNSDLESQNKDDIREVKKYNKAVGVYNKTVDEYSKIYNALTKKRDEFTKLDNKNAVQTSLETMLTTTRGNLHLRRAKIDPKTDSRGGYQPVVSESTTKNVAEQLGGAGDRAAASNPDQGVGVGGGVGLHQRTSALAALAEQPTSANTSTFGPAA